MALTGSHQLLWSTAVPVVLFLGALGAFFNTYRLWRSKGTWPIWQGTGWFLLTLMLISLSIPALAVLH